MTQQDMPRQWIHGSDDDEYLYKHDIYDLHAIPSIYLLDKDKKVLLKDCLDIMQLEKILKDTTKTPGNNLVEITE